MTVQERRMKWMVLTREKGLSSFLLKQLQWFWNHKQTVSCESHIYQEYALCQSPCKALHLDAEVLSEAGSRVEWSSHITHLLFLDLNHIPELHLLLPYPRLHTSSHVFKNPFSISFLRGLDTQDKQNRATCSAMWFTVTSVSIRDMKSHHI